MKRPDILLSGAELGKSWNRQPDFTSRAWQFTTLQIRERDLPPTVGHDWLRRWERHVHLAISGVPGYRLPANKVSRR